MDGVPSKECYLELIFSLRSSTNWAKAGHEVAFGQIKLAPGPTFILHEHRNFPGAPQCTQVSPNILEICGSRSSILWKFDIAKGTLVHWSSKSDGSIIDASPVLDFYRAQTDNDRPTQFGRSWIDSRLHQMKIHTRSVSWIICDDSVVITVSARIAPPVLEWSVHTTTTYTFLNDNISIKVKGVPQGNSIPKTFARIGLTMRLNNIESATWFGRGPGESYRDKKNSQRFGVWSASVDDLFTNYEFPQESGNRTDVRWVEFKGKNESLKASFGELEGASFSALHYSTQDLDECRHPYELKKRKRRETIVRLDWAHHGLGTGSCGPATLPQYELRSGPFEFEVVLK